jgi:ribosomal protein L37AE/L43A
MAEWGFRKGRREAAENLTVEDEGDCPRCGGEKQPSSLAGYLSCSKCQYEWKDPNHVAKKSGPPDNYRRDSELIEEFKREMQSGDLSNVLGIEKGLSGAQEQSLQRLEDKWMSGMSGHFNPASEERKPLMISFDDDDNLVDTTVGSITIVANGFDGGEEIRLEYPGLGTEFYAYDELSETGWRRGRSPEDTARSITNVINRFSKLVYANQDGATILLELRGEKLNPDSLVIFVDDPGGTDIVAEKAGVSMDPRDIKMVEDYRVVVGICLADGIISPSEDQMLWAMRQQLGIDDQLHVQIVQQIFGDHALKECTGCGEMAELYAEYSAWYCQSCESWC